jgi:hypothetical protein
MADHVAGSRRLVSGRPGSWREFGDSVNWKVANLGRKDILAPHLESLIALLGGGKKTKANSLSRGEHIEATVAACWGPMLVARSLWRGSSVGASG